jgi:hypothetical protein
MTYVTYEYNKQRIIDWRNNHKDEYRLYQKNYMRKMRLRKKEGLNLIPTNLQNIVVIEPEILCDVIL